MKEEVTANKAVKRTGAVDKYFRK